LGDIRECREVPAEKIYASDPKRKSRNCGQMGGNMGDKENVLI
jgi:hypothetical protein